MDGKDQITQQLNIEMSEEIAQGVYSNLAVITHSSSEFVIDFVRIMPGIKKANVKSRIILTPEHAKRFLLALQDNINKFESVHGMIKNVKPNEGTILPPMNFGGPTAQA
jgi:predicted transcriptional regulator